MPKKAKKTDPKRIAQREEARKQAKRKQLIITIIIAVAVIALAITAYLVVNAVWIEGTEVFTDGDQTVRLRPNGKFTASLIHGVSYRGEYKYAEVGEWNLIYFTHDGVTVQSEILAGQLFLPDEWQAACGHGHNSLLPRR